MCNVSHDGTDSVMWPIIIPWELKASYLTLYMKIENVSQNAYYPRT